MVKRPGETLSIRRQCALLNLARSGVYRPEPVTGADDLALMRRIDELHLRWPFYGSRRMVFELNQPRHGINRKRVQRAQAQENECRSAVHRRSQPQGERPRKRRRLCNAPCATCYPGGLVRVRPRQARSGREAIETGQEV